MSVKDQQVRVYRIKEVTMPTEGPTFPLRTARIAVNQRRLEENLESGHLDEAEPASDVEDRDGLTTADAIEDGAANGPVRIVRDCDASDDGVDDDEPEVEHEAPAEGSGQALVRIPRASRIYIPRVGPPPREPAVHLDLNMGIVFDQENPKRADTLTHRLYDDFKGARTVAEALELGATKGHIRYELKQGTARLVAPAEAPAAAAAPAASAHVIIFAAAGVDVPGRAPLIEAWCSEDSPLGKTGDSLKPARNVVRFTVKEDLSREQTILDALEEVGKHKGTHLHGSLPCTPWSSWQRLNLKKGGPSVQAKVARERAQSLEFIKTFVRVARPVLDAGGSVTFEWPRWCDGWKQPEVQLMIKVLKLTPVNIDGCAVGVSAEDSSPIMKPWRILVSSEHVGKALEGHLCDRSHAHARCEGSRTAGTAIYPRRLCELIHSGLDAHERARDQAVEVGTLVARSGAVEVGTLVARSVVEPAVGRDTSIDVADPCWQLFCLEHGIDPVLGAEGFADSPVHAEGPERGDEGHRPHRDPCLFGVWSALVMRLIPAKSPEFHSEPCKAALDKELGTLRSQGVWDEDGVRE